MLILAGDHILSICIDRNPFIAPEHRFDRLPVRNPLYANFSEEAVSWANKCIDRCNQKHSVCSSSSKPARLPTRVLDLKAGPSHDDVRLVDTQGKSGRYICLSHCWGKSQNRGMTTKGNLEANKTSISVDQLPPSMQDATAVTRKFGVRYLWVDSLCIIQDSLEDWSHQAGQMASIFENAYLTIGATSTESDDQAFLQSSSAALKLQVKTTLGTLQDLYVQPTGFPQDQIPKHLPLMTRAWCYQERYLSPRMLHFTTGELWWECRGIFDCVCGDHSSHRNITFEKNRFYTDIAEPQL